MSLLSNSPNDVKAIIYRLLHKSRYREVMDEYIQTLTMNIETFGHDSICYRQLETFGGAFCRKNTSYFEYNDQYRHIRWGHYFPTFIHLRKIYTLGGEQTYVPVPKRYKYSNGGFSNELKFIPFEER